MAHGLGNAQKVIDQVKSGEADYHFVEVMTCPGGCIGGGGQPRFTTNEVREKRIAAIYARGRAPRAAQVHENPVVCALYEEYLGAPLRRDLAPPPAHPLLRARPRLRRETTIPHPRAPADAAGLRRRGRPARASRGTGERRRSYTEEHTMTGDQALILIVDDDYDFLEINRYILETAGYRVVTATNPAEAGAARRRREARPRDHRPHDDQRRRRLHPLCRSSGRPAHRGGADHHLHLGEQPAGPQLPPRDGRGPRRR